MSTLNSVTKFVVGLLRIRGGTDGTIIGNTSDSLKVDTELSGAIAHADSMANPTTAPVIAHLAGRNEATGLQDPIRLTHLVDLHTGAGTQLAPIVQLSTGGASGAVETGTATNPLRTDPTGTTTQPISASSLPLPTGAATLAEQQTQTASLSVLDDWDETDRAKVNIIAGQVGVQGGQGVVTALTQRVSLATDQPAIEIKPLDMNTVTETRTTVSTSSVTVLAANADRKSGFGTNCGTTNIWVGFTSPAAASGASLSHKVFPGGSIPIPPGYDGAIFAISDTTASSQNMVFTEFEA